jgi:DNA-binding HxlR family transcriptional regulator
MNDLSDALKIIGSKWSALILYHLHSHGPSRFVDCQKTEGINPRTLAQRLSALEKAGLISKKVYNEYPPRSEYSLTTKGKSVVPLLENMAVWAKKNLH